MHCAQALLPRIQFDDELLVDDWLHLFARRDVRDFPAERVAIGSQPIGHWSDLGEIKISENELARFWFVFDRDLVARLHIVGSDVHRAAVHQHVAVRHQLPGGTARIGKPEAIDDVIQSGLEKLKKCFTGHAAFTERVLENAPELSLQKSILITQLLFFSERNGVLGLFPPGTSGAVHAWRIIFPLQRLGGAKERHAIAAAHFRFRSGVSAHG